MPSSRDEISPGSHPLMQPHWSAANTANDTNRITILWRCLPFSDISIAKSLKPPQLCNHFSVRVTPQKNRQLLKSGPVAPLY
jgi:hypothetical protein